MGVVSILRKEGSINTKRNQVRDGRSAAIRRLTEKPEKLQRLQARHLAIVRAALTFWDEEMGGASPDVYRHYLHSRDQDIVLTPEDIVSARAYFNDLILKHGVLDVDSGNLCSMKLVEFEKPLACSSNQKIASVLIH